WRKPASPVGSASDTTKRQGTGMPRARPDEGGGTAYVPAPAPQLYVPLQSPPSEGPLKAPDRKKEGPPAGWYRDPGGRHQYRFWSGSGWTRGVADGPDVS